MMGRQAEASGAVADAAHNADGHHWSKVLEHAVSLGLSDAALQPHKHVWKERQDFARQTLASAVEAAPFCKPSFDAACQAVRP